MLRRHGKNRAVPAQEGTSERAGASSRVDPLRPLWLSCSVVSTCVASVRPRTVPFAPLCSHADNAQDSPLCSPSASFRPSPDIAIPAASRMSSFLRTLKHAATAASDALGLSSSASNGSSHNGISSRSSSTPKPKKPACPYGSKCYRKNPQHRIDESHPGDEDDDREPDAAAADPAPPQPQPQPARRTNSRRGVAGTAADPDPPPPPPVVNKKASSSSRRGGGGGTAASDSTDATIAAAASPATTVAASSVSALPSTASTASASSVSSDSSSPTSPRVADKKMSVRDRRRKQKEEEGAANASMSPTPPSDLAPTPTRPSFDRIESAAARAAPATLPPIHVDSAFGAESAASATPLLASLHCLSASDLLPQFTEIRQGGCSATAADGNSGAFFIGRVSAPGSALKAADGRAVEKVHLQLNSRNPQLAKMISRVHASIRWERTVISDAAGDDAAASDRTGTKGLIKKRGAAAAASATAAEPSYTYRWFLRDEGSINGVFLNHTKLASRGRTELYPSPSGEGDRLAFGGGMGLEAGTFLKQDPEVCEFVFKFNAVTRLPPLHAESAKARTSGANGAHKSRAEDGADDHKHPPSAAAHASAATAASKSRSAGLGVSLTGVRKRVTPTASPLKRHRSDDPRSRTKHHAEHEADDVVEEDDDAPAASPALGRRRSSMRSEASSDAGVGDTESATQNFGGDCMTDDAHGGATQDFTDHDRDAARGEAQAGSTQDFGDAPQAASLGGEATQDAGGEMM